MENKSKLYCGIVLGVLLATTMGYSCVNMKNKSEENSEDTMGMGDLWSSMNSFTSSASEIISDSEITFPIESIVLSDGKIGYKIPIDYVPYQVNQDYSMPGMVAVIEVADEYKIITTPFYLEGEEKEYYTFDGAIGVYEPYAALLNSKDFILSKYGLSTDDEIIDYSFASLDDQELLKRIDQIEKEVVCSYEKYEKAQSLKLTK